MPPQTNKVQLYRELGGYLALVVVSIVIAWFLPDKYNYRLAVGFLCIGVFFDLMSLFCHVMTMATGKFMSGVPVIGLLFYTLFLLAYRYSLVNWWESDLGRVPLFKLADLAILLAFHALCQLPMLLQKPRSEYK